MSSTSDSEASSNSDGSTSDSEDEDRIPGEGRGSSSSSSSSSPKPQRRIMQLMPPKVLPMDHFGRPVEYKHAVRAEPYAASPLLGYLLLRRDVEVVVR